MVCRQHRNTREGFSGYRARLAPLFATGAFADILDSLLELRHRQTPLLVTRSPVLMSHREQRDEGNVCCVVCVFFCFDDGTKSHLACTTFKEAWPDGTCQHCLYYCSNFGVYFMSRLTAAWGKPVGQLFRQIDPTDVHRLRLTSLLKERSVADIAAVNGFQHGRLHNEFGMCRFTNSSACC